ncbi:hypothetical protein C1645_820727 [Glomus cerebriforme]|uniref:Uncharacterized protein n=1 Tax=Glomus cerebriforme TaxID=658196 RepID=A0A397TBN0_9GLOM|nr:hypothetical protein C1645_820727 [Glomus cerebriforme]
MDPKPLWIKIISDNGDHYYNSELMTIISYWYDWYNIKVRRWIFLEPGKAKTTVDSHYAMIMHAIKRYVKIGYDLTEGKNIETAFQDLSRTSSITGQFAGYIRVRFLSHIGKWIDFSPMQIANLCGTIHRPSPIVSEPTESHTLWIMPIPNLELPMNEVANKINEKINKSSKLLLLLLVKILNNEFYSFDQEFSHNKGWTLKENLKLNNKITDCYSSESMHACLEELIAEGELILEKIPILKTIKVLKIKKWFSELFSPEWEEKRFSELFDPECKGKQ